MPNINTPTANHVGPATVAGWQWLPFSEPTHLLHVRQAVNVIATTINGQASCNATFSALPGGRNFAQVWADPSVWISYDPGNAVGCFGVTLGTEIALGQYCCRMGMWTIAATLIHELAHVNGAGGVNNDAEKTLKGCLMKQHYDPHIVGQILRSPSNLVLASMNRSRAGSIES